MARVALADTVWLWRELCPATIAQPLSSSALAAADLGVGVALRRDEEAVASGLLGVGPHVLAHDGGERFHLLALLIVHHDAHARRPRRAGWTPPPRGQSISVGRTPVAFF